MTIYVDPLFDWPAQDWRKGQWCHMWSDASTDELVTFARSVGLKDMWLQHRGQGRWKEHFDLRPSVRVSAIRKGAVEITGVQYMKLLKDREVQS